MTIRKLSKLLQFRKNRQCSLILSSGVTKASRKRFAALCRMMLFDKNCDLTGRNTKQNDLIFDDTVSRINWCDNHTPLVWEIRMTGGI